MDVARSALRCGSEVTVFYRRTIAEMPAIREEIEEAEKEGVKFYFLSAPKEIVTKKGKLSSVIFQKMKLGEPDDSGRRRPVPIEGDTFEMEADSLFPAIGERADLDLFSDHLETEWNLISSKGEFGETSNDKLFAGGDIVTGAASVVEAIAAGRKSAERIGRFLSKEEEPIITPPNVVGIDDMNTAYFSRVDQNRVPRIPAVEIKGSFREMKTGYTDQLLHSEADRCFSCGVCNYCDNCWIFCPDTAIKRNKDDYEIDLDYCKGCLVCVEECPRSAFSTREEGR